MGQIYLVRHGQASFGTANYDRLSDLGVQQARLLGQWFAHRNQGFHRVVTGGMMRHRQTADACMAVLPQELRMEKEWESDVGFNEYDHHEVLLRHRPDFVDPIAVKDFLARSENPKRVFQEIFQLAMTRWMDGRHDQEYGEPWPVFRNRCIAAFQRLLNSAGPSQNIIVFSSGGTIATLCQHVLGLPDRQTAELNWSMVNCSVTKLFYQPGKVTLSYLNNYAHLESLGEKHSITYR
jgi:broad specificity phosphatase PhoE